LPYLKGGFNGEFSLGVGTEFLYIMRRTAHLGIMVMNSVNVFLSSVAVLE
jgi:hypothetical protein